MTIGQLRANITPREFESWVEFYKLFPFDDRHRFHRPAAFVADTVAVSMGGSRAQQFAQRMEFLSPEPKLTPEPGGFSRVDLSIMDALGIKPRAKPGKEH